jgi:hypothetical protein
VKQENDESSSAYAAGGDISPSRLGRGHGPLERLVELGRAGAATGCGHFIRRRCMRDASE